MIARTDHPSCPSLDKQALDRSKFSQSLCTTDHTPWMLLFASTTLLSLCPRSILPHCPECCTVSILQLNWRTNKILVIIQIRGAQTFTINRQGLECQTAINRIQHSYNPNFSELELSKVGLTYIHLQATNHVNITILQSLKLTQPSSWLCDMRSKSMHENTKS